MKNYGTFNAGIVGQKSGGVSGIARFSDCNRVRRFSDDAISNGGAFLVSELEKREPKVREPLTSLTYTRDVPIKVGGGWVEYVSALNIDFGITGGSSNGTVSAPGANGSPIVQMNLGKDTFGAHVFSAILRVPFVDQQRQQITGKSLDALLTDGIRLAYDKHMEANAYVGLSDYGTTGLLNNPNITAAYVSNNAAGTSRKWEDKTADEILADVNGAVLAVWAAAQYDLSAMPNHVLIPHAQYNILATTKVSQMADKTILEFLLDNNIAKRNGKSLVIAACPWCAGAGASSTDRMVVYCHNEKYLALEELVSLHRAMTQPNVEALAYDSVYMANISELELFYTQTIRYADGI
jgi:hypothetical protein